VELITPIDDPRLKQHIKAEILDVCLKDNVKARQLQPDGMYSRLLPAEGDQEMDSQTHFINHYTSL
jgi:polyphosphate kinase